MKFARKNNNETMKHTIKDPRDKNRKNNTNFIK